MLCHLVGAERQRGKNCCYQKTLLAAWLSQNFLSDGVLIESSGERTLPKVYQQQTAAQYHHNLQWKRLLETASGIYTTHNDCLSLSLSISASLFISQSCSIPPLFSAPQLNLLTCVTKDSPTLIHTAVISRTAVLLWQVSVKQRLVMETWRKHCLLLPKQLKHLHFLPTCLLRLHRQQVSDWVSYLLQ